MENFNKQPEQIKSDKGEDLQDNSRRNFLKILTGAAVVASGVGTLMGKREADNRNEAEAKIERKNESKDYFELGVIVRKVHEPKNYINPLDNVNPMSIADPLFDLKNNRYATFSSEKFIVEVRTTKGLIKFEVKEHEFIKLKIGNEVELKKKTDYETISDKQGNFINNKIIRDRVISFKQTEN